MVRRVHAGAMERKHKNLRDVGLSLHCLKSGGSVASAAPASGSSPVLRCGCLLRCGAIDSCTFEELRRPKSIINLRMGEDGNLDASLAANEVVLKHIPADNSLEKYDTTNREVQEWLQSVVHAFESDDLAFPVLLHCRSGKDRTGVVVALLLALLDVPEALIVREFTLSEDVEARRIRASLAGFRKAGGAAAYLSKRVDVERVKARFLGISGETEVQWLRQEVPLLCRLADKTAKAPGEEEEAAYWRGEAAAVAGELARRLPAGEAATALYYRGWALRSQASHAREAREALAIGMALGKASNAKDAVLRRLERESAALPQDDDDEDIEVVEREALDAPGNCHARLLLLDLPASEGGVGWKVSPCPTAFAWLKSGELAASAAPEKQHLPALQALGLQTRVDAELTGAAIAEPGDHWEKVVGAIAKALSSDAGCLVHCRDGFGSSGVALACFIIVHGLDEPVQEKPGQPKMTANEAIDVMHAMRRGCLASEQDEEEVRLFAQSAWARHVEKVQKAFSSTALSASAGRQRGVPEERRAPEGARAVPQPGDGNCLFHSLAHGLGSGTHSTLRADICGFMETHSDLSIAGTSLADWIQMLAGTQVQLYARKMAKGSQWGGAPEIAACAHMRNVNIHVYERRGRGFELTVPFDVGGSKTIGVLYVGGVHYDALVW